MPHENLKFAHRYNPDGTIDSICPRCFQTIAHVKYEAELPRNEQKHICDQYTLEKVARGLGGMGQKYR